MKTVLFLGSVATASVSVGSPESVIEFSYRPESVTAVAGGYLVGSMSPACDAGVDPEAPHAQCGGVHKMTAAGVLDDTFANITGLTMVRGISVGRGDAISTLLVASETDGGTVSRYTVSDTGGELVQHIAVGSLPVDSGSVTADSGESAAKPNCICFNADSSKAYVTIPGFSAKAWTPAGTGSGLLEIDMATNVASVLFWNVESLYPNGCDVHGDVVYLGNFNYPLASYNIGTGDVTTPVPWGHNLGFPSGQDNTGNVIADGIVAYEGDLFVGNAKLGFWDGTPPNGGEDGSAPTGEGNLWQCEGVLAADYTFTEGETPCKEIAVLPVADMQIDLVSTADQHSLILPSLFGHEVTKIVVSVDADADADADTDADADADADADVDADPTTVAATTVAATTVAATTTGDGMLSSGATSLCFATAMSIAAVSVTV